MDRLWRCTEVQDIDVLQMLRQLGPLHVLRRQRCAQRQLVDLEVEASWQLLCTPSKELADEALLIVRAPRATSTFSK